MRTETNKAQRLEFVRYWAAYVRTHPDADWSKQQALLIDSMLEGARTFGKGRHATSPSRG
jgi:hypothetical protein